VAVNFFAIVLVTAIFLLVSAFLLQLDEVTITQVIVNGNSVVTEEALRRVIYGELEGKYAFIFPKGSIFLYPRKSIEASVLDAFTRIQKADISFEDFQSIALVVEEREPFALWCGAVYEDLSVRETCYFLDDSGFMYTQAPHFTGNTFFRFYGALINPLAGGDPVGETFLSREEFRKINFFIDAIKEINLQPAALYIRDENDFELYLEDESKILFGRTQNLSRTLENIQSFFESAEYAKHEEETLEYADFRFGNKVYYQFK